MSGRSAVTLCLAAACALAFGLPAAAQQDGLTPVNGQTWEVNTRDQDIRQFIAQVSEITGKTFIVDPRVKGPVTIVSSARLDAEGIYQLLLSVLRVHGFGVFHAGDVIHVVQNPTVVKQTGGADESAPTGAPLEVVTQVITAQNVDAAELVKILRPMIPQYGHIAAVANPNVVILSDHADNIARLMRIIAQIDVANDAEFVMRPLRHAWVGNVVEILTKVAPDQIGQAAAAGPQAIQLIANERNNSLIMRGQPRPVAVILNLVDKLDVEATAAEAAQVIRLAHAQAAEVVDILTGLFVDEQLQADVGSPGVTIRADESLNAIVARADPGTMSEILEVVAMLDVRRTQVLIEAAIAEVSVSDLFSLGVEAAGVDARGSALPAFNTTLNGIITELLSGRALEGGTVDSVGLANAAEVPTVAVAKLDTDGISFGAVLNALSTNVAADLLSAPSVLTLDNHEAKNLVGQNVPFRSGSFTTTTDGASNPFNTVERQDIGITFTVTPHIYEGSAVRLEVHLVVENLAESGIGGGATVNAADLITQKREIQTTVLADDQQTIALGGLIQDDIRATNKKVPLLGDVPVLGRLFRSQRDTRDKRNLIIFLRPTVLNSKDDVRVTTDRLYNRIYEVQIEARPESEPPPAPDGLYGGRQND